MCALSFLFLQPLNILLGAFPTYHHSCACVLLLGPPPPVSPSDCAVGAAPFLSPAQRPAPSPGMQSETGHHMPVSTFRRGSSCRRQEWDLHLQNRRRLTNNTKRSFQPELPKGRTHRTELPLGAEVTFVTVGGAVLMHHLDPPSDE